ncbi:MAG: hypothetical protein QM808_03640 [Steroidobacteraceae bacterium]
MKEYVVRCVLIKAVRSLLLAWIVISSATAAAWSPYNEQKAVSEMRSSTPAEPDHLVPFVFADGKGAYDTRPPRLDELDLAWCEVSYKADPSFSDTTAWCLQEDAGRYQITSYSASRDDGSDDSKLQKKASASISKETATLIQQIWINALLQARYPKSAPLGLDGAYFYFRTLVRPTYLQLFASTYSPGADLPPRWMVDAGETVNEFVLSDSRDEKRLSLYLIAQRNKLFNYLRKTAKN